MNPVLDEDCGKPGCLAGTWGDWCPAVDGNRLNWNPKLHKSYSNNYEGTKNNVYNIK